ncbi:flagellar hook-associated protein FlgK [Roseospira goensis]|uniref:Flagellar hook-associated protein 1 n=1 Tax=Roseospira goensis TaxID=391922 RepID=A0A7W6S001_9PROT|nr:flagellar hook-associated protein FlgK [Roseospira goensis]MBB4286371.1 flagellar hook-associated protein 1 FlgK [Roseospira goensis]
MSLNLALSSALSGLQTNQKGLDLVSRNIANVNTVGYTKKIFNQESRVLSGTGAGVQVTEVTRRVDFGLIEELNRETAKLEELSVRSDYYDRMQDLFGTPADNSSIAHIMAELVEEVETLALEPDKTEQHLATVQRAEDAARKLNSMGTRLQQLRLDADQEIERTVDQANGLLHDIQTLNEEIAYALATGRDGTDLIDQRDVAVQQLTSLMNVTTFTRGSGELTVYTEGGSILVDREVKELNHTALSDMSPWQTKGGRDIQGITLNGADITDDITEGKLSALIDMRDSVLTDYQAQIDELTRGLADTVNQVNNRGTSYPNLANEYVGTRTFLDTTAQEITLDASHDTVIGLFDADGTQVDSTTLKTILGSPGPHTLEDVRADLATWLAGAGGGALASPSVTFTDGKLDIKLNSNDYGLSFKDVKTVDPGDPATWVHEDATISFNADGDGASTTDSTHQGFASFLGLNDVYTAPRADWAWDSGVKSAGWRPFVGGDLVFSDNDPAGGLNRGTLTIAGTDTLQDIADKINDDPGLSSFLEAEVVREGEGVRLRVKHREGYDMAVTQSGAGTDVMTALGLGVSSAGLSNDIAIKDEISANPSLISRGSMLYNADTGEYTLSAGDNSTANAMAEALRGTQAFDSAGRLPATTRSLIDHATLTLSLNAREASTNETRTDYQTGLVDTLNRKHAEISAVNMDEELAQLIIFEQSYAASAKVIATTAEMFDVLNSIV